MLLIAQENLGVDDAPIGFGFRLTHFQNRRFQVEFFTRAYRVRQFQPIPAHSGKDMESWLKPVVNKTKIEKVWALDAASPQKLNAPQPSHRCGGAPDHTA